MKPEEIRNSIIRYYDAYYAELRRFVPEYASVSEAIPDFLKDHKRRIVVAVCRDGAVLEHRVDEQIPPDQEEFFEFHYYYHYYYRDRTIKEVSGFGFDHDPNIPAQLNVAEPRLHEGTDTTGPVVWEAPWQRMDAVNNRMISRWTEELGRAEARNAVLTLVNAHLMGLAKVPPQEVRERVIAELEAAVDGFAELLDSDPGEEMVQMYLSLKRNKILLEPSAVSITPKVELGSEYVTDLCDRFRYRASRAKVRTGRDREARPLDLYSERPSYRKGDRCPTAS